MVGGRVVMDGLGEAFTREESSLSLMAPAWGVALAAVLVVGAYGASGDGYCDCETCARHTLS